MQLLGSEYQAVVLWIDSGIVAIPLFKVDVPSSSQLCRVWCEFSGSKPNDQVECEKYSDHCSCRRVEDFWLLKNIANSGDRVTTSIGSAEPSR